MDAEDLKWASECRICGAMVSNTGRHREWHEARGEREEPRSGGGGFFA